MPTVCLTDTQALGQIPALFLEESSKSSKSSRNGKNSKNSRGNTVRLADSRGSSKNSRGNTVSLADTQALGQIPALFLEAGFLLLMVCMAYVYVYVCVCVLHFSSRLFASSRGSA